MDNTEHTTAKLALKGETALSLVLAGLAAADKLSEHYEEVALVEKAAGRPFPANYYEGGAQDQYDIYWGLKEAMSFLPAATLPEAAAQIGQAINEIDCAYDEFPDDEKVNDAFKKMKRKLERLLYSALAAVQKQGGFSLHDMGLRSLDQRNCSPWRDVDVVVDQLKLEGVK